MHRMDWAALARLRAKGRLSRAEVARINAAVTRFLGGREPGRFDGPWCRVFDRSWRQFRPGLKRHGDEDPWVSYGLSYLALRKCADLVLHRRRGYFRAASENAHKRHLRQSRASRRRVAASGDEALEAIAVEPDTPDLAIDLAEILSRWGAPDGDLFRMRLIEGQTFEEIGDALGMDQATAHRRFNRRLGRLRSALAAYR
jgi:hypothetical protein